MPTQENCSVLLKAEFNINGTNSLRAGQTCPISFVARGMVKNETERSRITLNGTNITCSDYTYAYYITASETLFKGGLRCD